MKYFLIIIFLPFLLLVTASCTSMETGKKPIEETDAPVICSETITIAPFRSDEECVELLPGNILEYSFRASKPLKFNIHYHAEDELHYPVSMENVDEWKGVLDVGNISYYTKEQEYFCLMWENPHSESVSITYQCRIKK